MPWDVHHPIHSCGRAIFEGLRVIADTAKPAILIADDDSDYRQTLREIFAPCGYQTLEASNGEEAITIVEGSLVDCLLLDMHMPILSGLETLQIVRQINAVLPCIMITGDSSERLLQQALALHVFTVLCKPVSRELVTVTVRRALRALPRPQG